MNLLGVWFGTNGPVLDALWIPSSPQQPKQLIILSSKMLPGHLKNKYKGGGYVLERC